MTRYLINDDEYEYLEPTPSDHWAAVEIPDDVIAAFTAAKAEWERVQEVLAEHRVVSYDIRLARMCKERVPHLYADDPKYSHWPLKPEPCWQYVDENGVCPKEAKHV